MRQKRLYIVHGYDASAQSHWFGWLKGKMTESGINVSILSMPTPATPKLDEWLGCLKNSLNFDDEVYLVGHSLGCPTLLNFAQRDELEGKISGLLLVGGFAKSLPNFKFLDEFTRDGFDYKRIKNSIKSRAIIAAKDDYIVPFDFSNQLAKDIDAKFYEVEKGGHFMSQDGFNGFDLAFEILAEMMDIRKLLTLS